MSTTPHQIASHNVANQRLFLFARVGATGTPDAAGYALVALAGTQNQFVADVPEPLVGDWNAECRNSAGVTIAGGVFYGVADSEATAYEGAADVDLTAITSGIDRVTVAVPRVIAESVAFSMGDVQQYRGTQWAITLNDVGAFSSSTAIYFTLKSGDVPDAESLLQVRLSLDASESSGLIVLNKAEAATPADASITYEDYTDGADTLKRIVLTVNGTASATIKTGTYDYDFKIVGDIDKVLEQAKLRVQADVTRAV